MSLFPIVDRELRVAARQRSTYWLRLAAALIGLLIGWGFLLASLVFGTGIIHLGSGLFGMLTWLSLAAALSAGVFFTSDCLSEEKREGTLGLLFLTDLRGYDVAFGKLLATSLRGGFALLAVFPVLAITLLLGGVTGGQLWRTLLAIVNALVFSLVVGLFVSVFSRDSQRALAGTVGLLLLFLAGAPLADSAIAETRGQPFTPIFSLGSPGYAFTQSGPFRGQFWTALGVNQFIVWSLFALTCWRAPRCWQERSAQTSPTQLRWEHWWKYGGPKRRAKLRAKLLDVNPALWLAARERWQALVVWFLAAVVAIAFGTVFIVGVASQEEVWIAFSAVCIMLVLVLYLWTASQACRFFLDARRCGLLELLLASPLDSRRITDGAWRALARSFGTPVAVLLVVQLIVQTLGQSVTSGTLATATRTEPVPLALLLAISGLTTIGTLMNLIALIWYGLWMGLTSKSVHLATLKTLVFVQIVPWFVITIVTSQLLMAMMVSPALQAARHGGPPLAVTWVNFLLPPIAAALAIVKDLFFIHWARTRLFGDLREIVLQASTQVRLPAIPPVLPAQPKP